MSPRRARPRPADAYAWPAVLALAAVVRLGLLMVLPEVFAWRVTPPIAALHVACDLATMALVRQIAIVVLGSAPIGTLAAAGVALHPHLVFESLSRRDTAVVLFVLHALVWLVVRWHASTRQLGVAAAIVAGVSGVAVGVLIAQNRALDRVRAEGQAHQVPRVERGDRPATPEPAPSEDPLIDYGRVLEGIYGGVAVALAFVGAFLLRSQPTVLLLAIPPLVCAAAGLRFDHLARLRLPGEPLLLVLSAHGLAAAAVWWASKPGQGVPWGTDSDPTASND
jgi:hypothetical protein